MMAMQIILVLLVGAAFVAGYRQAWLAVALSAVALATGFFGHGIAGMAWTDFGFWILAAAVAAGICFMVPKAVGASTKGMPYMCTGGIAGVLVGVSANSGTALILGAAIGVALGALAFGRSPSGRAIRLVPKRFVNYCLAKGYPLVVAYAIAGIIIANLLVNNN